jgi:hypothetical protein
MVKVQITKEEAQKIAKLKGNVSGAIIKAYEKFILNKKGEKEIKKVEERLAELGQPLKFAEVSSFGWYPESLACLIGIAILEIFDWDEKKEFEVGHDAPLYSIITKLLMQYFSSIEITFKGAPIYWRKHFDFAELRCTKLDTKKKLAILRLTGFKKFHPTVYIYMQGYLTRIIEFGTHGGNVKVEQTKCLYNNDPYDEFKASWK